MTMDSFSIKNIMSVNGQTYHYFDLKKLSEQYDKISKLPYSLRVLLENLLRHENGVHVTREHIESLIQWDSQAQPTNEISFVPSRSYSARLHRSTSYR